MFVLPRCTNFNLRTLDLIAFLIFSQGQVRQNRILYCPHVCCLYAPRSSRVDGQVSDHFPPPTNLRLILRKDIRCDDEERSYYDFACGYHRVSTCSRGMGDSYFGKGGR